LEFTMSYHDQYDNPFDDETEDVRVARILAEANPAFRGAVQRIEGLVRGQEADYIRKHYEIGQLVLAVECDVKRYGHDGLPRLGRVLGWAAETLACDRHLASAFTPDQIEKFAKAKLSNGYPLAYRHLTMVASVKAPDRRNALLQRIIGESLTVYEVGKMLCDENRQINPDSKRGRPLKAPKDFNGIVRQLGDYATDFIERDAKVWSADDHSLSAKAINLSSDEVTEKRLVDVRRLAGDLRLVALQASVRAEEAEAVLRRFTEILEGREGSVKRLEELIRQDESEDLSDDTMPPFDQDLIGVLPQAPFPSLPSVIPVYIDRDQYFARANKQPNLANVIVENENVTDEAIQTNSA
jgi:hypothetical protein